MPYCWPIRGFLQKLFCSDWSADWRFLTNWVSDYQNKFWQLVNYWFVAVGWLRWVTVSGGSIDINTVLITVLVTHSLDDTPLQCPTIVVSIIHIQTEPLTQLHKLLTKILMGLLMVMFTFISCSVNIIPSDCDGGFYELNFKRSAGWDYPSLMWHYCSRHHLIDVCIDSNNNGLLLSSLSWCFDQP